MNSAYLWSTVQLVVNKKYNYFLLPDHQLAENLILLFGLYKRTKKDKSKFVSKFVEIIDTNIFMQKSFSNFLWSFCSQCFNNDHHLKHKTVNKTTCRTPSANPCQLCAHLFKSFPTTMITFWGFQDFQIYLADLFWITLNSPNFTFQLFFCKSNVNKTV